MVNDLIVPLSISVIILGLIVVIQMIALTVLLVEMRKLLLEMRMKIDPLAEKAMVLINSLQDIAAKLQEGVEQVGDAKRNVDRQVESAATIIKRIVSTPIIIADTFMEGIRRRFGKKKTE
jgi:hypothetical protein